MFYPVIIPTLNRYEHFKRCVDSLSRCLYADQTELVIGLDYPPVEKYIIGYEKIKQYIPSISGFAKVTVFYHDKNLGSSGNYVFLREYCFRHYDAYISTEDDNEFSPSFLVFMNHALLKYREDKNVVSVCGYNPPLCEMSQKCSVYFSKDNCAWGIGVWKHKEFEIGKYLYTEDYIQNTLLSYKNVLKIIFTYPALLNMLVDMCEQKAIWGDVLRTSNNIATGTYQLKPSLSLVRNWGYDGSGEHCKNVDVAKSQERISDAKNFDWSKGVKGPFLWQKGLFVQGGLPAGVINKYKYIKKAYNRYLLLAGGSPLDRLRVKMALSSKLARFVKLS